MAYGVVNRYSGISHWKRRGFQASASQNPWDLILLLSPGTLDASPASDIDRHVVDWARSDMWDDRGVVVETVQEG
jgi:hypothetical protein